jgi:hypothetical protein
LQRKRDRDRKRYAATADDPHIQASRKLTRSAKKTFLCPESLAIHNPDWVRELEFRDDDAEIQIPESFKINDTAPVNEECSEQGKSVSFVPTVCIFLQIVTSNNFPLQRMCQINLPTRKVWCLRRTRILMMTVFGTIKVRSNYYIRSIMPR